MCESENSLYSGFRKNWLKGLQWPETFSVLAWLTYARRGWCGGFVGVGEMKANYVI